MLVPPDFAEAIGPIAIRVENPTLAFSRVLEKFAPEPIRFAPGVHPSAVVAPDAVLGENVSVQPFAVIEHTDETLIAKRSTGRASTSSTPLDTIVSSHPPKYAAAIPKVTPIAVASVAAISEMISDVRSA